MVDNFDENGNEIQQFNAENIDQIMSQYAMQKAAGIMYFSEENLAKVPKILDLLEEIKSDRTKIDKFIN
jgi:hypothetical protein